MQGILSLSAGYEVGLSSEFEHFKPEKARAWLAAESLNGQIVGFIRHFDQGNDWSLGEIFVELELPQREEVARHLLSKFKSEAKFPAGHRLRFDVLRKDTKLNQLVVELGYSENRQVFRHYVRNIQPFAGKRVPAFESGKVDEQGVPEIASVLCHLHPAREDEVRNWISSGTIRVLREGADVVAAAQIYSTRSAIEINRFATHIAFLRHGYGKRLLDEIVKEAQHLSKSIVYLKVEEIRTAAIGLYQKSGFIEQEDLAQIWHSSYF